MVNFEKLIPKEILILIERMEGLGYEAWLVGGAVRDALLEKRSLDFDIAVNATPAQMLQSLSDYYKVIPTGLKYGTVTILINQHINAQVTTYRSENGYSDARHPDTVEYITNIESDLSRRDFTINALAWNPKLGLLDNFNGICDLYHGIIRTVGDAAQRFDEDPLRILRALRFSSTLEFSLEKTTLEAARKFKDKLKLVSPERIADEWDQLLKGKDWLKVIERYKDILAILIPYIEDINANQIQKYIENYHRCKEIITSKKVSDDIIMTLHHVIVANLCNASVHNVKASLMKLRYSRQFQIFTVTVYSLLKDVKVLLSLRKFDISPAIMSRETWKILEKYGYESVNLLLEYSVCFAELKGDNLLAFRNFVLDFETGGLPLSCKDLCVDGSDVIDITGYGEGEIIGVVLEQLRQEVISGRVANSRRGQIEWLETYRLDES